MPVNFNGINHLAVKHLQNMASGQAERMFMTIRLLLCTTVLAANPRHASFALLYGGCQASLGAAGMAMIAPMVDLSR